jgi:hypothetical protein
MQCNLDMQDPYEQPAFSRAASVAAARSTVSGSAGGGLLLAVTLRHPEWSSALRTRRAIDSNDHP